MIKIYIISLTFLVFLNQINAQPDNHSVYYVASYDVTTHTIEFYSMMDTTLTPLGTVSAGFEDESSFQLESSDRVAISPDGRFVALVGKDLTIPNQPAQLRVYELSTDALVSGDPIPLETDSALPSWSPNSEFVLTNSNLIYTRESQVSEFIVYSLGKNIIFNPLANYDKSAIGQIYWTPDNLLMFANPVKSGEAFQMTWLNPDGSQTGLKSIDIAVPRICDFVWSSISQRWYFITNCTTEPNIIQQIYSFSLNGDIRQETDLSVYNENYPGYGALRDIQVTTTGVYFLTGWASRIVRISYEGQSEIVGSVINALTDAPAQSGEEVIPVLGSARIFAIAPDNKRVILIGGELGLAIVDLETSAVLLENNLPNQPVCNATWLNNQLFVLSACIRAYTNVPVMGIYVWDTQTNTITNISEPVGATVWLLGIPFSDINNR
jgi:hypothetical protein